MHVLKIGSEFWEFQQTETWSVVDALDIQTLHYRIKFEFGALGGRGLLAGVQRSRFACGDIISDLSQIYTEKMTGHLRRPRHTQISLGPLAHSITFDSMVHVIGQVGYSPISHVILE